MDKLNLRTGILDNVNLDFEVTLVDSGGRYKLEDRDLANLLQRKLGMSPKTPIKAADRPAFTGELDFDTYHDKFYADYETGSTVNLTASSDPQMASMCTVRIQGDLTGTIPSGWNQSGDAISSSASNWNELTIMYVTATDVRVLNRSYAKA